MAYQTYPMTVENIALHIVRKPVKYLRIKVRPPEGRVHISVPFGMSDDAVRHAVLSKIDWIRKHQLRMAAQPKQVPLEYISGENIRFQGRNYILRIVERSDRPHVALHEPGRIDLHIKPGSDADRRRRMLDAWCRQELKSAIPPLLDKWQRIMGVQAAEWRIKRMKTRWGTCNIRAKRIWINLELIRQPSHLLEFIIVHELTHLLEPSHNSRFKTLMDRNMPDWRRRQKELKHAQLGASGPSPSLWKSLAIKDRIIFR